MKIRLPAKDVSDANVLTKTVSVPQHDDQIKHQDHARANFNRVACDL